MFRRPNKRNVPEVNATSTADMAFILLVFFLLSTSIGTKKSIRRELPSVTDSVRAEPLAVKKRDLLEVRLDGEGRVFVAGKETPASELKEKVKHFIENSADEASLPEKHKRDLPLVGTVEVTDRHVIALRFERQTHYKDYFFVQNRLAEAYRELRDAGAWRMFHCSYARATPEQQEVLQACYPQRISESLVVDKERRAE